MPTLRAFGLLLGCPVLLLLAAAVPILTPVAFIYGIGIVILIVLDRRSAGPADQFTVSRTHEPKLSLGAQNRIVMHVISRASRAISLTVRDEPPELFVG